MLTDSLTTGHSQLHHIIAIQKHFEFRGDGHKHWDSITTIKSYSKAELKQLSLGFKNSSNNL